MKMNKRSTKFYRKNEAEVMERLGFSPTINSGAGWIEKEDGQNEQCICQLKSTDRQSISIKLNDLHILEQNAVISHKLPVFAFQFLQTDEVWIAIKESDIEAFKDVIQGKEIESNFDIFDTESIDSKEEKRYNIDVKSNSSLIARQQFYKQKAEEMEQRKKENKERNRKKWQQRKSNKRE